MRHAYKRERSGNPIHRTAVVATLRSRLGGCHRRWRLAVALCHRGARIRHPSRRWSRRRDALHPRRRTRRGGRHKGRGLYPTIVAGGGALRVSGATDRLAIGRKAGVCYALWAAPVAQWIERRRPKPRVGGSSPSRGATFVYRPCAGAPASMGGLCLRSTNARYARPRMNTTIAVS